ncbi:MAG: hypothetical protein JRF36_17645 [Deltaproteobacteria bacterium]|jgi:hypothetical protein|nr:hypothetical protein [Deltaproteobacteria bacterium]
MTIENLIDTLLNVWVFAFIGVLIWLYFKKESTTTRKAGGLDFTAKCGKRQGHAVPRSLRVKPGAKHPVWKTQSKADKSERQSSD